MNDHAMDARTTETLNRLHVRYRYALQKSMFIARRMTMVVAEEAATNELIIKICSKHTPMSSAIPYS